jgi:Tfp pilus assembly protein PilV
MRQPGRRKAWLRRRPCLRPQDDDGFALLECLIGFSLFAVVILATGSGAMISTVSASSAQERSVAATLISADVASATALPFSALTLGLNPSADTLANDPNISKVGANYILTLTGATLAATNTSTSQSPLVPHISTTTIGIPYTVATYPETASNGTVTLVVIVTWKSALGGNSVVMGSTEVAAP